MGHGWLGTLCIFSLCLVACGKKAIDQDVKGESRWSSFPVTIYAGEEITSDADASKDLEEAMAFWEQKAGRRLFDFAGTWTGDSPFSGNPQHPDSIVANVIFIQSPWSASSSVVGQTVFSSLNSLLSNSMIMLNPNTLFCNGDCTGSSLTSERKTFAHELGHFLGMKHASDPKNIMYPSIQPGGSLASVTVDGGALHLLTD